MSENESIKRLSSQASQMAIHTFGANGGESTLTDLRRAQDEKNDDEVDLGTQNDNDQEMQDE